MVVFKAKSDHNNYTFIHSQLHHFFQKKYGNIHPPSPLAYAQLISAHILTSTGFFFFFFFLKFGAMHFIYQLDRLTTTKVDSTYLG